MIRLAVRVARDNAAAALAELLAFSPAGVEELDGGEDTIEYVLYGAAGELPSLPALRASVGDALVEVTTSEIADDWATRWRSFHRPIVVAARLYVRPPWHEPADGALIDVMIDPGQAFGTGSHATTRLCLELLVALAEDAGGAGGALLDIGCGSGVLGIAAAKLGFDPVIAIDHEAESVLAAGENARANGVSLDVRRADLGVDELPAAPVITANLLRPLLLELAPRLQTPPRALIASGLLIEQADEVAGAFRERHGMRERARREEGDWAALLLDGG